MPGMDQNGGADSRALALALAATYLREVAASLARALGERPRLVARTGSARWKDAPARGTGTASTCGPERVRTAPVCLKPAPDVAFERGRVVLRPAGERVAGA